MKITHRFYLREPENTDAKAPIYMQITCDRKTTKRAIGYELFAKEWDNINIMKNKTTISQRQTKKRYEEIKFFIFIYLLIIITGCKVYKTDPLGYNGEIEFQHKAKVTKFRIQVSSDYSDYNGGDTIYVGTIESRTYGSKWSAFEFKTRPKFNENQSFYLVEFTNINSMLTDAVWFDRSRNQLLIPEIGIPMIMNERFNNGKFSRELLVQIFFSWMNKNYYKQ